MNINDFLILAQAAAPGAPQQNLLVTMMPLVFIFVIFYFLLIRPQQKKQKDKTIIIKIADNVKVEFDRAAVVTVEKSASDT